MGIEVGGRHRIPSVIPHLMRESRKYFFSKQIKGKESGSPIKLGMTACVLSRMTFTLDSLIVDFRNVKRHRMTKKDRKRKEWILSQAENDRYCRFPLSRE